jgi:Flp pilus assembly protein TadG
MILRKARQRRSGAHTVEFAVIAPVVFFLVFAIIEGSTVIFEYEEVASLTREGARWASVHGYQYQLNNNAAKTTASDVYTNAIQPHAVMLVLNNVNGSGPLAYSVSWQDAGQSEFYYDSTSNTFKQNFVTVTVTYKWSAIANLFPVSSMSLRSTTTMPISN